MKDQQSKRINATLQKMYSGELNPLETALKIDRQIGGITRIDHRVGTNLKNHQPNKIGIDRTGLGRKEYGKLGEFATLCYWIAQRNGSIIPGEVHLEKGISSKHYKRGFQTYQQSLLERYLNIRYEKR